MKINPDYCKRFESDPFFVTVLVAMAKATQMPFFQVKMRGTLPVEFDEDGPGSVNILILQKKIAADYVLWHARDPRGFTGLNSALEQNLSPGPSTG